MAINNVKINYTVEAQEDLSGCQHKAVALADGKVANNGAEASGILENKPESGDHAGLGFIGVLKYHAGGGISKDDPLTVVTSGWVTLGASGDYLVGRAMAAVTSGSFGTSLFNFTTPVYAFSSSYAW